MAKKKQDTAISAEAIAALRAASFDGNTFVLSQDNLPCYGEVKALVGVLGGRWVSGRKRHEFPAGVDARSLVLMACDHGVIPASNPNDFFPTRAGVVDRMTSAQWMAERLSALRDIAEMDGRPLRFLEPNGGSGSLVTALVGLMQPKDELVVVELNPLLAATLRANFPQARVVEGDFLGLQGEGFFDIILMNPPFAGKTYAKHVAHAYSMLGRQGVLASVVPSSFINHGDDFLYLVAESGLWEDLGEDMFDDTKTATSLIWMQNDFENKWREKPFDGFKTQHAWNVAVSIASDADELGKLAKARDFSDACALLRGWAGRMLRDMSAVRVDESIARDALCALVRDYEHPELAHLLPQPPPGQMELGDVAA